MSICQKLSNKKTLSTIKAGENDVRKITIIEKWRRSVEFNERVDQGGFVCGCI